MKQQSLIGSCRCARPAILSFLLKQKFLFLALFAFFITSDLTFAQNCTPPSSFDKIYTDGEVTGSTILWINKSIKISGTVTFNTVTFQGCTLYMEPNARIVINSRLTMNNSSNGNSNLVYGCDNMWHSITINANASVQLRNCTIRNGQEAIVLQPGYKATSSFIADCTFGHNIIGIKADNVPVLSFTYFRGNTFNSSGNSALLLPPFTSGMGTFGIKVSNCTGTIGSAGTQNLFKGMAAGIWMESSNIAVNNCNFVSNTRVHSPLGNPGATYTYSGCGIYSFRSNLTVQGSYTNGRSCEFSSNFYDIYSGVTNTINVENISSVNPINASIVVSQSIQPNSIKIIDNDFNTNANLRLATEGWIEVQRAEQGGGVHTTIQGNTFNIQPAGALQSVATTNLIYVNGQPGTTDGALIYANRINNEYGNPTAGATTSTIHGIVIGPLGGGYTVSHNIINYNLTNNATAPNTRVTSIGIYIMNNGTDGNLVEHNRIRSTYYTDGYLVQDGWLRCGIHAVASPHWHYCQNDVGDITNHYHFIDNNSAIEFGRNTTAGIGAFGLIADGTIPNNHDFRGNLFLGTNYEINGAQHNLPSSELHWLVDNQEPTEMPPSQQPNSWFMADNDPRTPLPCDNQGVVAADPQTGKLIKTYLAGQFGVLTAVQGFDMEYNLMTHMIAKPATFAGNTDAEQYYNSKLNSIAWQLANARNNLRVTRQPDAANLTALFALFDQNTNVQNLLQQIETEEAQDLETEDPLLQAQKTQYLTGLDADRQVIQLLQKSIWQQRLAATEQVKAYIESIPVGNELEENRRTLLLLQAKQAMGEAWTASEEVNLRTIANGCPDTWGEAVIDARAMLPTAEANTYPVEGEGLSCSSSQHRSHDEHEHHSTEANWAIWPNPATDRVEIAFQQAFTGQLVLLDALGKQIQVAHCNNETLFAWDLGKTPNGIYIVKAIADNGLMQNKTIMVNRK